MPSSSLLQAVAQRLASGGARPVRPATPTPRSGHSSGAATPANGSVRNGTAGLRRAGSASALQPRRPPTPPVPAAQPAAAAAAPSALDEVDLVDFIATSPILAACGLDKAAVAAAAPEWARLGALLAARLGLTKASADSPAPAPPSALAPAAASRIYRYYLPIFFWVKAQVAAHKSTASGPLVLGINAPQGCGKTTLVTELEALAAATGLAAATVSIDDFYLTRAGQAALAAANPGNPLLELRGNAGSHDLELGQATLRALCAAGPGDAVPLPRYDKAAHGGLGDRAPSEAWPVVQGPLDLVLLEGWMLGFKPVGAAAAAAASPHLPAVDAALGAYEAAWDSAVAAWLVIAAPSAQCVYAWRAEAEDALRASGRGGMSPEAVADFCDRYMPAYAAYGGGLIERGPTTAVTGKVLVVGVREDRSLADDQPAPPRCK